MKTVARQYRQSARYIWPISMAMVVLIVLSFDSLLAWTKVSSAGLFLAFFLLWHRCSQLSIPSNTLCQEQKPLVWLLMIWGVLAWSLLCVWALFNPLFGSYHAPSRFLEAHNVLLHSAAYLFYHWALMPLSMLIAWLAAMHWFEEPTFGSRYRTALKPMVGRRAAGSWGRAFEIVVMLATVLLMGLLISATLVQLARGLGYLMNTPFPAHASMGSRGLNLLLLCALPCFWRQAQIKRCYDAHGGPFLMLRFMVLTLLMILFAMVIAEHVLPEQPYVSSQERSWEYAGMLYYWGFWLLQCPLLARLIYTLSSGRTLGSVFWALILFPLVVAFIIRAAYAGQFFSIPPLSFLTLSLYLPQGYLIATLVLLISLCAYWKKPFLRAIMLATCYDDPTIKPSRVKQLSIQIIYASIYLLVFYFFSGIYAQAMALMVIAVPLFVGSLVLQMGLLRAIVDRKTLPEGILNQLQGMKK